MLVAPPFPNGIGGCASTTDWSQFEEIGDKTDRSVHFTVAHNVYLYTIQRRHLGV